MINKRILLILLKLIQKINLLRSPCQNLYRCQRLKLSLNKLEFLQNILNSLNLREIQKASGMNAELYYAKGL